MNQQLFKSICSSLIRAGNRLQDASFRVTSFSIGSHVLRRQAWESSWLFVPKEKAKKDAILARPCEMIIIRCQRLQLAPKAILIPFFNVAIQAILVYNKTKRNSESLRWYTGVQ